MLMQILAVALGGAVGSALRYLVNLGAFRAAGAAFPLGTLLVNVIGSLLAGLLFGLVEQRAGFPPWARLLLLTGFLGGFTTFSSFSIETIDLFREGAWTVALLNFAGNNLVGLAAALGGIVGGIHLGKGI